MSQVNASETVDELLREVRRIKEAPATLYTASGKSMRGAACHVRLLRHRPQAMGSTADKMLGRAAHCYPLAVKV